MTIYTLARASWQWQPLGGFRGMITADLLSETLDGQKRERLPSGKFLTRKMPTKRVRGLPLQLGTGPIIWLCDCEPAHSCAYDARECANKRQRKGGPYNDSK